MTEHIRLRLGAVVSVAAAVFGIFVSHLRTGDTAEFEVHAAPRPDVATGLSGPVRALSATYTRQSPSAWPDVSPCEFLRPNRGEPALVSVESLTSYTTAIESEDVRSITGDVYTVALVRHREDGEWIRLLFRGGRLSEHVVRTAEVGVAVGGEMIVFIDEERYDDAHEGYWITEQEVLHVEDGRLIGPLGLILDRHNTGEQRGDVVASALRIQELGIAGARCEYAWSAAESEQHLHVHGGRSGYETQTVATIPGNRYDEDRAVHLPTVPASDGVPEN